MSNTLRYGFILMLILIVVVYASGTSTAIGGITNGLKQIIYALTGRDTNGTFHGGVGNNVIVAGQTQAARF